MLVALRIHLLISKDFELDTKKLDRESDFKGVITYPPQTPLPIMKTTADMIMGHRRPNTLASCPYMGIKEVLSESVTGSSLKHKALWGRSLTWSRSMH